MRALIVIFLTLFFPARSTAYEAFDLPVGTLFNQHQTQYCWAYSSFHSLRSYYMHLANRTPDESRWRAALETINEPSFFRSYLEDHFPNRPSEPMKFTKGLMKSADLPAQGWRAIIRSGLANYTISFDRDDGDWRSLDQVKKQIRKSLEKGVPTAYCGNGHCTAIYGAVYDDDGNATKYYIADSVNHSGEDGRRYEVSASKVHGSLEILMAKD